MRAILSGYRRAGTGRYTGFTAPVTTDVLGTGIRTTRPSTARSHQHQRARAGPGGWAVSFEPLALAEALAFNLVRDRTVVTEVRLIPPHTTLHLDGRLRSTTAGRARPAKD